MIMRFQVVPPCGGHPVFPVPVTASGEFQVVPPCGGHLLLLGNRGVRQICFKSCPRVGGISRETLATYEGQMFQVVPPCGGHQFCRKYTHRRGKVSSRAPVWGASEVICLSELIADVSSRAPVWGASSAARGNEILIGSFKSCPRVGGIRCKPGRS